MASNRNRGFTLIELVIVLGIIGMLSSIAVPFFFQTQSRARQAEAKAALKSWYTAESSVFGERGNYFETMGESGFSPGRGNRYQYLFSASCSYEIRTGINPTSTPGDSCVTVDQFRFPTLALTPTPIDGTFTYSGTQTNPTSPAGLGGVCPNCAIRAMAAGNIDNETHGVDTWVISSKDATAVNITCGTAETAAPAGMPFNTFNDAACD
jgi:type IV pilus assembly protein PilA